MNSALLAIGLLSLPLVISVRQGDPYRFADSREKRLECLERYFERRHSPLKSVAGVMLDAAEEYALDWRLIPSIAVVESGAGKYCRRPNNVLGWRSGKQEFPSVASGIRLVARKLAHAARYRDKSTEQKLQAYNPVPGYQHRIKAVMRALTRPPAPSAAPLRRTRRKIAAAVQTPEASP